MSENKFEPTYPHFRNNINIQHTAPLTTAEVEQFPAYSTGVNILTNPAGAMNSNSDANALCDQKQPQFPVMGSPNLPVCIKVQKEKDPRYLRILNIVQMVTGILFVFFIIAMIIAHSSDGSGSLLERAVNSHHQIVVSSPVRFKDVQGCDQIKSQLVQVVDFLKNPEKFEQFGASMPRGYLLEGPPGVGKTLLAKAVAGEADVPFLVISGAEFDEIYVGVGASRVRSLFKDARKFKKAVIFIDEIDAVAGRRDGGDRSNSRQTLNQLLVEMDGFKTTSSVIILAATNTVQSLDPALLRPGRFDKTLTLSPPDITGRKQILIQLIASIPANMLASDVKAEDLAATTIGYTGADLANLINQAKLIAATDGSSGIISRAHLDKAKNFIDLGPERSLVMNKIDKERVAFHEAGHAIVALANPNADPVQQATIVPHSNALGLVRISPDEDAVFMSRLMLEASIDIGLAGFIAEEIKYGSDNISTSPSSDLENVNRMARYMVRSGFGKRTGFLQSTEKEASEMAKRNFEDDVQEILNASRDRVRKVLKTQEVAWSTIANALIEKETLQRSELETIFKTKGSPLAMKAKSKKMIPETELNL
jgi:ATP-dependent metalloprotease FtsH